MVGIGESAIQLYYIYIYGLRSVNFLTLHTHKFAKFIQTRIRANLRS